jgi:two-component system sensor histidine kinase YesM
MNLRNEKEPPAGMTPNGTHAENRFLINLVLERGLIVFLRIKYKYIIFYSIMTILPIIMIDLLVYQILHTKMYRNYVDIQMQFAIQVSDTLDMIERDVHSATDEAAEPKRRQMIDSLLRNASLSMASKLLVIDSAENVRYQTDLDVMTPELQKRIYSEIIAKSGSFLIKNQEQDTLVTYYLQPGTNWYLVALTPTKVIYEKYDFFKELIVWLIAVSVALSLFSISLISSHVTAPIGRFRKEMEKLKQGDLNTLYEYDMVVKDEIWDISLSFNEIVSKLRERMKLEYQLKVSSDEAKLLALQSQINPHFLYNTLETINSIAIIENVPLIAQLSRSLSKMFRYNSLQERENVLIKDELEHIEHYLHVQMIRFDGLIEKEMEIDPQILECKTIKFILQPIVENCFVHAFNDSSDGGKIWIIGRREGDRVVIQVIDNGQSMAEQKVNMLNAAMAGTCPAEGQGEPDKRVGIGIYNVNQRIKIAFGEEYGLHFRSNRPHGLIVEVTLPYHKERSDWHVQNDDRRR